MGVSLDKQSPSTLLPPKPFPPSAPSCPGSWLGARSVPPLSLQGTGRTCATPVPFPGTHQRSGAGPAFLLPSKLAQNAVSEPNPSGSGGIWGSEQVTLGIQGCRACPEQRESPYLRHNFFMQLFMQVAIKERQSRRGAGMGLVCPQGHAEQKVPQRQEGSNLLP